MNYEILILDFVNESLQVVQKKYFKTLKKARQFEQENQYNYYGISILPMNAKAHIEMEKEGKKNVH